LRRPAASDATIAVLISRNTSSTGTRDERLSAVEMMRVARRRGGRWSAYCAYPGRQWFQLEPPSASRVLHP
jgi:hypothetical protein